MATHIIQVFEHQTLRVGDLINGVCFDEAAFKAMALYQEKQKVKYFNLVYNGVKFSHYVGIIQIGKLTLEILPKADNKDCLLYTSPSPRDATLSRMPSSA